MKYIIYEINGIPSPVLFPDHIPHRNIAVALSGFYSRALVSAGFFTADLGAHGQSESLNLSSREEDTPIITNFLRPFVPFVPSVVDSESTPCSQPSSLLTLNS